jgi:serine phosphatase RsbU (regulator of sigma subunit)
VGRFVAAAVACIDEAQHFGEVWVGGTPDMLWLRDDGLLIQRFESNRLALGIVDSSPLYAQPETFEWDRAGQLFACSDGVLEARDAQGEHFGRERLLSTLAASPPPHRIAAVRSALEAHVDRGLQTDDISLLCIDLPA